ncbi:phage tail assembly chaperone [Photobacterium sp. 1_MG-2023]|uniref:phage tail assembly chaperone n=1 Tax=Photobacterium sp. 1_MG-2023 TaxID=3062646 RepID=UPI0026E1245F|nr:phage tail assembly chaperone [Photobacterium sp. 1_MG-2023]MDO6706792.1 phage tail assembly chaperone [Photobacterium sp. 1_MG-2023]
MEQFFTREKANEGIQVPLYLPDGTESEHWLKIRGVDSDAFREAESESRRLTLEIASLEDEGARKDALKGQKVTLLSSLILSWSFEEACTAENVQKLLTEAPQIADQIDRLAAKRSLFFGKRLSS